MDRKRFFGAVCAVLMAGSTPAILATPAAATPKASALTTQGPFYFVGWDSGKCIDDPRSQSGNNVVMDIYTCVPGAANEQWKTIDVDNEFIMIKNVSSGKCLTVKNAVTTDNAAIIQYDCNSGYNQQWYPLLENIVDGLAYYELISRNNSGTPQCLTVKNAATTNNAMLLQYNCAPVQGNNRWTWLRPDQLPQNAVARAKPKTAPTASTTTNW